MKGNGEHNSCEFFLSVFFFFFTLTADYNNLSLARSYHCHKFVHLIQVRGAFQETDKQWHQSAFISVNFFKSPVNICSLIVAVLLPV